MNEIKSLDEYNYKVKTEVEQKLNINTNKQSQEHCLCHKKEKNKFYYRDGVYNCFSGSCGLKEANGNYHDLNKEFNVVKKEDLKFEKKETIKKDHNEPDYIYRAENGEILYGIKKYVFEENGKRKKSFNPAYLDQNKNWLIVKTKNPNYDQESQHYKNIRKVLYNLNLFSECKTLWVVEGEKCADMVNDQLKQRGLLGIHVATTNVGGAGKWIQDYNFDILNTNIERIVIIPDNDKTGLYHARKVYHELEKKALILIPDHLDYGQGIDDWLENSKNKFDDLINHANRYDLSENYAHEFLNLGYEFIDKNNVDDEDNPTEYELNEVGVKNRFIDMFGENLMFVEKLNWYFWNGTFWEETDEGQKVRRNVEKTIREYKKDFNRKVVDLEGNKAIQLEKKYDKFHNEMMSFSKINNILKLAKFDSRIYRKNSILNNKDNYLNVLNGVIDLKTGYLMSHKREYYFTKVININFPTIQTGLPVKTDLWNDFIKFAFMNRDDLINYVQMMVGYSLSGSTKEQNIFFMSGTGANGKSTFTNIIQMLLGGYYSKLNSDSLMANKNRSPINNDIASLHECRLVTCSEIEKGSQWNMSLVKDLSGGDDVKARFLKQEFFNFKPKFKIWMYGNYKPYTNGLDEGTRRRFRIIPSDNKIEAEKRNDDLEQMLKEELPGILLWAVEGAKKYFELKKTVKKIPIPDSVQLANDEYFRENDPLIEFLEDYFDQNNYFQSYQKDKDFVDKRDLFKAYKEYCDESNSKAYTKNAFSKILKDGHGFKDRVTRVDGKVCRVYYGMSKIGEKIFKERERKGEL